MNETAQDGKDDIDIYEESSCSASSHTLPGSPQEGEVAQEGKEMKNRIIKREEKAVRHARLLVAAAIFACAVAVSTAIYVFASNSDQTTFELEYEGYVSDITSLVQWEVQYNFALMQQLSAAVTSAALMTGSVFPNVTLPHFEITGGYVDGMGGIKATAFAPLIKHEERSEWEEYAVLNQGWLAESARLKQVHPDYRDALHGTIQDHEHDRRLQSSVSPSPSISTRIYRWESENQVPESSYPGQVLAPLWQVSPASAPAVNENLFSNEIISDLYETMIATNTSVLSTSTEIKDSFDFLFDPEEKSLKRNPHGFMMEPVYSAFEENPELVGFLIGVTAFGNLLDRLLPADVKGIVCVIKDACGNHITYELNGLKSIYLGAGDLHDPQFDEYERSTPMELYETTVEGRCSHELYIYPSGKFRETYATKYPAVYTSVVALAFLVTSILLFVYDRLVTRRQDKMMQSVLETNRFVSTLFPANVRDRVLNDANDDVKQKSLLTSSENKEDADFGVYQTRPIADYFPYTTVMFADISGFTAWSSTREPFQVFQLLETLYGAFDDIAERRRVFKVETVGDCYVAVCGLPLPRKDHAVVMARFARDCTKKANKITRKLEVLLGPDTADLAFRIGLHSGSVTGGVLRGKNARFQLFGDTMNTASRMESTGARDRVQVSTKTAELLIAGGKSHWITPRGETVTAKGKGQLATFWLTMQSDGTASVGSGSTGESESTSSNDGSVDNEEPCNALMGSQAGDLSSKDRRLVDWNVALLSNFLQAVIRQRNSVQSVESSSNGIEPAVVSQLQSYVTGIANMYRDNPFHNFEHASHVTMSTTKLLSRVVTTDDAPENRGNAFTNTIASDALTQLAAAFSALIHDVDHTGLPNARLVEEEAPVAVMYDKKSVAEKNSIALAWEFLLRSEFSELRACIGELERFHDLVTDAVMATDIADKELKEERNARWATVFRESAHQAGDTDQLKATIVLNHMMQAADVSHTMQHWFIYRKWNERLFHENWKAYTAGRAETNPVDTWYESEMGFFDFYVIPLAERLDECGVFGVSSDEYLEYALENRREWESKGKEVVKMMVDKYCRVVPVDEENKEEGATV